MTDRFDLPPALGRLDVVQNGVYASGSMRFTTDRVNAAVGAATFSHRVEPLIHLLVKVDRVGFTVRACHVESFRHSVNSDHSTRAKHPAALNGHLRYRTATPHGICVAGLDFRILRGHLPSKEDVREKENLLRGHSVAQLHLLVEAAFIL
jgi:hypothetical protein